jgi:PadR family transcriptional regulator PadR
MKEPRLSMQMLLVLRTLRDDAIDDGLAGADITWATEIASGTMYPILARLERARWVTSSWEAVDPSVVGRPRRRLYQLTATGTRKTQEALAKFESRRKNDRSRRS